MVITRAGELEIILSTFVTHSIFPGACFGTCPRLSPVLLYYSIR